MSRDLQEWSDEELAAALAAGTDEAICRELYERYRRRVYLWCHGYAHDLDEAVDLTQEVFIKIFTRSGDYAGRARFSTWVYAVARNHCLGRLARRSEVWRQRLAPLDGVEVEDGRWARELRAAEVAGSLDRLLERARSSMAADELEAFVLHYRDGLTVGEISRTLKCTNLTGARTLIQNARRKFRRLTAGEKRAEE
ncbi:MAG: RNA polymerase sigma factor [Krumholzibacteria bacterium]|nr:RNA polymerase sigma factor [Candidatus Krumholzibacteria bacterium]